MVQSVVLFIEHFGIMSTDLFLGKNFKCCLPIFLGLCFGCIWILAQMPSHNRHTNKPYVERSCVWLFDPYLSQATNYHI